MEHAKRVAGIAHQRDVAKVTFVGLVDRPGVAQAIFDALAAHGAHADMIVQNIGQGGRTDLSFTVTHADLPRAMDAAEDVREDVDAQDVTAKGDLAKVSVVGAGLLSSLEYASVTFGTLGDLGIYIDMISTSGIRITCVIEGVRVEDAVRGLHAAFRLDEEVAWPTSA
jgi:aspartate kinase